MNKLLKEFLSYVLEARKKSQNTPPREPKHKVGDVWQPINPQTKQRSTTWSAKRAEGRNGTRGGFPTRAAAQAWLSGKGKTPGKEEPTPEKPEKIDRGLAVTRQAEKDRADAERAFRQGGVGTSGTGEEPAKPKRQKKAGKLAVTADHGILPTDTAVNIVQKLINSAKMLVGARRKGIPGPGGAVASYGESILTELANRLTQGGLQQGLNTFREKNKDLVERKKAELLQQNKRTLENKITTLANILGLDAVADREFVIDYLATREAYVEEELKRLIDDKPDGIFYRKGNRGFGEDRDAAEAWARAAFDGAVATAFAVEGSLIDRRRPFTVIQSDAVPGGHDDAIVAHLTAMRDAAPEGSDDRRHYQTQLDAWEVAKFHDTMVVGEDKQGRMVVFHVTNKKGNELKDIWNNTTPADAMQSLHDKFAEEVNRTGEGGLTEEEKIGFAKVQVVLQTAVKICQDASAAATSLWSNPEFAVDDDVVAVAHGLRKPKDYVGNMGAWMDAPIGPRVSASKKEFDAWTNGPGKRVSSAMRRVCQGKGSASEKCTKARMQVMSEYMKTNPSNLPPYEPIGKLLVKIGEQQIKRDEKSGTKSTGSLGMCAEVKRDEKDAVEKAHSTVVSTIQKTDEELCKKNPASCKPNGPATRMYLSQLMHSMHFDIMAENWDDHIAAVTGGRTSRPSDFRHTLADRSGYSRDNPEPTVPPGSSEDVRNWRKGLEKYIINNAIISADSEAIRIRQGGESGEEFELIQDTWRTAGSSQKVQKNVGDDVRTGVIELADSRRKDSGDPKIPSAGDIIRDSLK